MNIDQNQVASVPQHLGRRALSFLISKHSHAAVVLFLIAIATTLLKNVVGQSDIMIQIILWSWILFIVTFIYAFIVGWLVYANYTFALEDDAFKIRRGVISKKETAIPYRQIRDVNIERSFFQQMAGVSKLVILTVGEESLSSGVSESVIPVVNNIDKHLALAAQAELLKRANVQKISQS